MAITEQTREEDERLREELRHLDLEKLKRTIKPLLVRPHKPAKSSVKKRDTNR
jgi:hypothetical protein